MPTTKQASFTGGEIAPSLQSRTDLEKYYVSLSEAYNVFIHAHGGVSNVAGTVFVGEVQNSAKKSRLIAFEFNTTQTYILEFGDSKFRVIKDGAYVLASGGAIYEITSPYPEADLPLIKFVQSADVLYITHPGYTVRSLSRTAHDNWTFAEVSFTNSPFTGANKYPRATTFFEQRQVFGGTITDPDTTYLTEVGDYASFAVSSPLVADDAITVATPARQVNEIRHYVPMNDLIILTSGSEFKLTSGDNYLAYDTVRLKPQSYYGCSNVPPLVIGSEVLFVQARGSLVRTLGYSLEKDGYSGSNLSVLANHFFSGHTIKEWCFAQIPNSVIYAVRDDGKLLMLTYMPEQEVWGWSLGETDGFYESVASVPEGEEDAVYFIVKRTINGATVRHVERMHTRTFNDVRDCFFVHDGLSLDLPKTITGATKADPVVISSTSHGFSDGDEVDIFDIVGMEELNTRRFKVANKTTHTFELTDLDGDDIDGTDYTAYISGGTARKAVSTVSGLGHLEGETVSCLCDGNVESQRVVTSGAVSFDSKFSRIHVGLPYTSRIKTLRLDLNNGSLNGKKRNVAAINIEAVKTRGVKGGTSSLDELFEIKQREYEKYADPTELFTGSKRLTVGTTWGRDGEVILQQDYPLPMTITAILPEVQIGG